MAGDTVYPGSSASVAELMELARDYRRAAHALLSLGMNRKSASVAPLRLSALHAIELYLNALLLHLGRNPEEIRGLQHDLGVRTELALAAGLPLRRRTVAHLRALTENREYLTSRYDPGLAARSSPLNRLIATVDELDRKVGIALATESSPGSTPRARGAAAS
jgi:hypothetical protein